MLIYGTLFGGKIKEAHGEWIESKFILLMVPLIPYKGLFVTAKSGRSRSGFEIPVDGASAFHGYLRFFSFILALVGWGVSFFDNGGVFGLPYYVWGGIFGLLYSWSRFQASKSTGDELIERTILKSVVGTSALPEWLPISVHAEMKENLKAVYHQKFADKSVSQIPNINSLSAGDSMYLYTYIRYHLNEFDYRTRQGVEGLLAQIRNRFSADFTMNPDDLNDLRKESEEDMADDVRSFED